MTCASAPTSNWNEEVVEAFERFRRTVTHTDEVQFQSTTLRDVWKAAREVEARLAAKQSLRNLRRIRPFLDGLDQYSKAIEVLCNGTPYLPWIWVSLFDNLSGVES